jgi:hypothetical protein
MERYRLRYANYEPQICVVLTFFPPKVSARDEVVKVERKFTTGIRAYANGSLYRTFDPLEPVYVGPPTKEIDRNWGALTESIRQPKNILSLFIISM